MKSSNAAQRAISRVAVRQSLVYRRWLPTPIASVLVVLIVHWKRSPIAVLTIHKRRWSKASTITSKATTSFSPVNTSSAAGTVARAVVVTVRMDQDLKLAQPNGRRLAKTPIHPRVDRGASRPPSARSAKKDDQPQMNADKHGSETAKQFQSSDFWFSIRVSSRLSAAGIL
jgi:hypothetical protein